VTIVVGPSGVFWKIACATLIAKWLPNKFDGHYYLTRLIAHFLSAKCSEYKDFFCYGAGKHPTNLFSDKKQY
jgi:hypothetical protein